MFSRRRPLLKITAILALGLILLLAAVGTVSAHGVSAVNTTFTFSLDPKLEDPDSAYTITGQLAGVIGKTNFTGNDDRVYIRTQFTGYIGNDFVAELTFTLTDLPGGDFALHC